MDEVIQTASQASVSALPGAEANCPRKLTREFCLVFGIALSVVIGEKDELVDRGQSPKDVVRADIPTTMRRQNLVRLDPKNSQPAFLKLGPRRISIILWAFNEPTPLCVRKQS